MSFFKNVDFESLSDVDQSIWNFLSGSSEKIPYMRVRDIAHESHTSPSSVMRFVKKLGYDSFPEFRLDFKGNTAALTQEKFDENILNREKFPKDIDFRLTNVAKTFLESENVIFFGVGMSAYTCEYAARLFAMLGFNTTAFTDSTYPLFQKLENTSDNVMVVLSITGNTSEIIEIMNGVKNAPDYTSVAITSDAASRLALMSDHILNYSVDLKRDKRYMDFTSQIPAMYLLELLCEKVRYMQQLEKEI